MTLNIIMCLFLLEKQGISNGCQVGWKIHMENPYGFFFENPFFLICFNTYEL